MLLATDSDFHVKVVASIFSSSVRARTVKSHGFHFLALSKGACTYFKVPDHDTWVNSLWHPICISQCLELTRVQVVQFLLKTASQTLSRSLNWFLGAAMIDLVDFRSEAHLVDVLLKLNLVLVSVHLTLLALRLVV